MKLSLGRLQSKSSLQKMPIMLAWMQLIISWCLCNDKLFRFLLACQYPPMPSIYLNITLQLLRIKLSWSVKFTADFFWILQIWTRIYCRKQLVYLFDRCSRQATTLSLYTLKSDIADLGLLQSLQLPSIRTVQCFVWKKIFVHFVHIYLEYQCSYLMHFKTLKIKLKQTQNQGSKYQPTSIVWHSVVVKRSNKKLLDFHKT